VPVVPVSFVLSLRGLAGSDLRRRRRRKESLSDFCRDLRRDRVGLSQARPAAAHKQSDASRSSTVVYFSKTLTVSLKYLCTVVFLYILCI